MTTAVVVRRDRERCCHGLERRVKGAQGYVRRQAPRSSSGAAEDDPFEPAREHGAAARDRQSLHCGGADEGAPEAAGQPAERGRERWCKR